MIFLIPTDYLRQLPVIEYYISRGDIRSLAAVESQAIVRGMRRVCVLELLAGASPSIVGYDGDLTWLGISKPDTLLRLPIWNILPNFTPASIKGRLVRHMRLPPLHAKVQRLDANSAEPYFYLWVTYARVEKRGSASSAVPSTSFTRPSRTSRRARSHRVAPLAPDAVDRLDASETSLHDQEMVDVDEMTSSGDITLANDARQACLLLSDAQLQERHGLQVFGRYRLSFFVDADAVQPLLRIAVADHGAVSPSPSTPLVRRQPSQPSVLAIAPALDASQCIVHLTMQSPHALQAATENAAAVLGADCYATLMEAGFGAVLSTKKSISAFLAAVDVNLVLRASPSADPVRLRGRFERLPSGDLIRVVLARVSVMFSSSEKLAQTADNDNESV